MYRVMGTCSVLFDLDHTLCIDNHLEERVLQSIAQEYCRTPIQKDDVLNALLSFRNGDLSLDDMLIQKHGEWSCFGKEGEELLHQFKSKCLEEAKRSVVPLPGALETITRLGGAGIRVAIFTNGWSELQRTKAALIGFDGTVITSEDLNLWKPNRLAFEQAAHVAGFELKNTIYVGDSPESDVVGAKNAGMMAVWVNMERKKYPSGIIEPDFVVDALPELPQIMTRLEISQKS